MSEKPAKKDNRESAKKSSLGSSKSNANSDFGVALKKLSKPSIAALTVPSILADVGKLACDVAVVPSTSFAGGSAAQSSATGSTRNKYGLPPGHSLMDWIRLGASGKDLTGVGAQAGHLSVTKAELARHNKMHDAWLSLRDRVYNVTAYLTFHPGGPEELMKGVGTDATKLFEDIHPWVNYEQILSKCYIGVLSSACDVDDIFGPKQSPKLVKRVDVLEQTEEPTTLATSQNNTSLSKHVNLPKFDWIQKLDYITVIFYTGHFFNPMLEMKQANDSITILLYYDYRIFENEVTFLYKVEFPGQVKIIREVGKVEMVFRKVQGAIWNNYGVLKQKHREWSGVNAETKQDYLVRDKKAVNYNTFLVDLNRKDHSKIIVPLGKHVKVFHTNDKGEEISRSYTPVPQNTFTRFQKEQWTTDSICLMVKRYPDGNVSRFLADSTIGDTIRISRPLGSFELESLAKREVFMCLAAGTGLTPMLAIILFLLERRLRKCQRLQLLFFNRTTKDILLNDQLSRLQTEDDRFNVHFFLSDPDEAWHGTKTHVTRSLLEEKTAELVADSGFTRKDVFFMVCGPQMFTNLAYQYMKDMDVADTQYHLFLG